MKTTHTPGRERRFPQKLLAIPHELVCFVAFWAFAWLWYGEVFAMARGYSFFSSDPLLMRPVLDRALGGLWVMGRAWLNLFAYPWLGSAALAFLLAIGSWLFGKVAFLPRRWQAAQYLPAMAYLYYLTWQGLDAFVYAEPGRIAGIPFAAVAALLLLYPIVRWMTRRPRREDTPQPVWSKTANLLVPLLLLGGIMYYGQQKRPEVRATAHMQHLLDRQEWEAMARTAQEWEGSCRPVAAYHAIALLRTGHLLDDLFKVRYDFDPVKLTKRNGRPVDGLDIYEAEADFQSGLWQTAYRKDMELTVLDGVCTARLKRMVKCAILNGEANLALRYLQVLSHQPFERKFIRRYRTLALQPERIRDDKELAFIRDLRPDFDLFESFFISPLFIGFPLAKFQAENPVRREMSTAAALYTKNMPVFLGQASYYLRQPSFPPVVGDALGLAYANNQLGGMDARPLMPYTERLMAFTRDIGPADPLQVQDPGHTLFHKYRGFYPYYYFFGNRNLKPDARTPEKEKGGVN